MLALVALASAFVAGGVSMLFATNDEDFRGKMRRIVKKALDSLED